MRSKMMEGWGGGAATAAASAASKKYLKEAKERIHKRFEIFRKIYTARRFCGGRARLNKPFHFYLAYFHSVSRFHSSHLASIIAHTAHRFHGPPPMEEHRF